MTVKELIDELSKFPVNTDVRICPGFSGDRDVKVIEHKDRDCNGPYVVCEIHTYSKDDKS